MKKLALFRAKGAIGDYVRLNKLNRDDYIVLDVKDSVRGNRTLKSLVPNLEDPSFRYMLVHKSAVVIRDGGKLSISPAALAKNADGEALNTPEEEQLPDYKVREGKLKSLLEKVTKAEGFDETEREELVSALKSVISTLDEGVAEKSVGGMKGDDAVRTEDVAEETVDELGETKSVESDDEEDEVETKSCDADDEAEEVTKSVEAADESDDAEETLKSIRESVVDTSADETVHAVMKSLGSISEEEPVFRSKRSAAKFAQWYNQHYLGSQRAEVGTASRHDVRKYGTRAKFRVDFS